MNTIRTASLVLKTCNMNDNDKLITFFSPEYGRLTAIAKGVRSHKHKDFAALQPFCFSDVTFTSKQGGLYTVSFAQVTNNFFDLRNDVIKVSFATYYMDIVADIAQEIVGDEDYFKFVLNTLYLTEKAERNAEDGDILPFLKKLKAIFEIKTVCVMGVMPELGRCVSCGKDKKLDYFSHYEGGVACSDCIGRYDGREHLPVSITEMDIKIIDYIVKSDYRSVFSFSIAEELLNRICAIVERYLVAQTDTFYKSLGFLHKIIAGNYQNDSEN
ncbi:MAG: DNA repair protein RecO [Clostridia bacterium]|nr:DNA repair protein RecO [Clostridia bacterium]